MRDMTVPGCRSIGVSSIVSCEMLLNNYEKPSCTSLDDESLKFMLKFKRFRSFEVKSKIWLQVPGT